MWKQKQVERKNVFGSAATWETNPMEITFISFQTNKRSIKDLLKHFLDILPKRLCLFHEYNSFIKEDSKMNKINTLNKDVDWRQRMKEK